MEVILYARRYYCVYHYTSPPHEITLDGKQPSSAYCTHEDERFITCAGEHFLLAFCVWCLAVMFFNVSNHSRGQYFVLLLLPAGSSSTSI